MTTDGEREGHEHVWQISYDQPYTYAGNTLSKKILCQMSVYIHTENSIDTVLYHYVIVCNIDIKIDISVFQNAFIS